MYAGTSKLWWSLQSLNNQETSQTSSDDEDGPEQKRTKRTRDSPASSFPSRKLIGLCIVLLPAWYKSTSACVTSPQKSIYGETEKKKTVAFSSPSGTNKDLFPHQHRDTE
jgi:hypothetical protein